MGAEGESGHKDGRGKGWEGREFGTFERQGEWEVSRRSLRLQPRASGSGDSPGLGVGEGVGEGDLGVEGSMVSLGLELGVINRASHRLRSSLPPLLPPSSWLTPPPLQSIIQLTWEVLVLPPLRRLCVSISLLLSSSTIAAAITPGFP